jgi:hypothetical protein
VIPMNKYFFLFALVFCQLANADSIDTSTAEQSLLLPITNGSPASYQQIFSVCSDIPPSKTADVRFQVEVTNPYTFNVGIGWGIKASDYNGSTLLRTFWVTPLVMQNVTPSVHHMVIQNSYLHTVGYPTGGSTRCYALVLWAAASSGTGNIQVERGYGYLQVGVRD